MGFSKGIVLFLTLVLASLVVVSLIDGQFVKPAKMMLVVVASGVLAAFFPESLKNLWIAWVLWTLVLLVFFVWVPFQNFIINYFAIAAVLVIIFGAWRFIMAVGE